MKPGNLTKITSQNNFRPPVSINFLILTGQICRQRAYHWVFDCVHQSDYVGPSSQVLQDLDLSLDLLLLDWLISQEK